MKPRMTWRVLALTVPCLSPSTALEQVPGPRGPQPALILKGHAFTVSSIAFSPDGRLLASASNGREVADTSGEVKVWDLKAGRQVLSLRGHKYGVWKVAFSPDGKRLASAGTDEVVKVWDVATGKELLTLRGHTADVYGVAWSPDGKSIASCGEVEQGGARTAR